MDAPDLRGGIAKPGGLGGLPPNELGGLGWLPSCGLGGLPPCDGGELLLHC